MSALHRHRSRIGVAVAVLALAATARGEDRPTPADAEPVTTEATELPSSLRFGGPIELQDVFLPAQTRPQAIPESATTLPRGSAAVRAVVDWSNHLAQGDHYLFDGESVTTTIRLRYAPLERLEVGVDVPWTTRFDGTLDPFIEDVETALDARVQERFVRPRDTWTAIAIRDDGSRTLRLGETAGFGDVVLRAKWALVRESEHGFDAAVSAGLGLPTGGDTFGGQGVTPMVGLHAQLPFRTVNLLGGATLQWHSDAVEQDFPLAPWRWMTYAGAEWRPWQKWLGLLAEFQVYGPLARGYHPLDRPAYYYAFGLRFYLPHDLTLETGVVENLGLIENRNSTDVSFHFALGWRFDLLAGR